MRPLPEAGGNILAELRRRSVFKIAGAWLVAGWLLIQVADTVAPQFDLPGWLPRLVTLLVVLGFPVAIVLAWAFEITPAGIHRDSRSRNTRFIVALAVVFAVGALAWYFRTTLTGSAAGERTIAVLPFANLAADPDSDYLADGLAEELLGALGHNPAFRVTARSSAFQFKGQNRDLREIGQKLGVRYILEGSVRMAGTRVRIGAQLVDTENGTQLWNESYDRTLADLFALQRDIAFEVERALEVVLVAGDSASTLHGSASVEAHIELLRALQVGASRTVADLDQAIAHLQRALALDPGYAAAYAELAYAMYTRALQLGENEKLIPTLRPLLEKALQLDPQLGAAVVLQGSLLTDDPVAAERLMSKGLELSPSHARGYEILAGTISQDIARTDEAMALINKAIALDPLSPRNYQMKGIMYWNTKSDAAAAEANFRRALEVDPRFRNAMMMSVMVSMTLGKFAAAVDYAERALAVEPPPRGLEAEMVDQYLNIGDLEAARGASLPDHPEHAISIALYLGDTDTAMALLRATPRVSLDSIGNAVIAVIALRHARAHGTWTEDRDLVAQLLGFTGTLPPTDAFSADYAVFMALVSGAGDKELASRFGAEMLHRLDQLEPKTTPWQLGPLNWQRAMLLVQEGRHDKALDALERAFEPPRPFWWRLLDNNPVLDPLHEEPRYKALRERLARHLETQRALLTGLRRDRELPESPNTSAATQ